MRSERIWRNAALATALLGSVIALAGFASSHGHGCHSGKFLQRMVDAHLDEALDDLKATPEQRTQINQLKTGLTADFQAVHDGHQALMTSLGQQFSSDRLDAATLDADADPLLKAHDKLRVDLRDAIVQIHDLLTPAQRQQVAAKLQEHSARCSK